MGLKLTPTLLSCLLIRPLDLYGPPVDASWTHSYSKQCLHDSFCHFSPNPTEITPPHPIPTHRHPTFHLTHPLSIIGLKLVHACLKKSSKNAKIQQAANQKGIAM